MASYHIDVEPVGRRGECQTNQSLLEAMHQMGVELVSLCGGKGTCFRCKIQILDGEVSPPTSEERGALSHGELKDGYRLACQTYPASNCRLYIPPMSLTASQRAQVEGLEVTVTPDPPVHSYQVKLPSPSWSDLRADAGRLLETLKHQHQISCHTVDIEVLRDISSRLRSGDWQAQVSVRDDELIAVEPCSNRQLGLAIDLGTTKIAAYLIDLDSGEVLATEGIMNPQISCGEDIITRITRVIESPDEGIRLQKLAVEALNQLTADLCARVDAEPGSIVEALIVGNTAMHHLLLRLPVHQLALSPFLPAVSESLEVKARDVGLRLAAGAYVHLLPNIAGFVGADHVAMLLATEVWKSKGVVLAIDIGTNTEVALVSNGEITTVSCASGPAFEGAHIKDGMRAATGAIEHWRLVDNRVEYETIGGVTPVGLCGSGILDALAQLYLSGVLETSGRMGKHPRVRTNKGQREFVLVSEEECGEGMVITLTQNDVRQLQLAKGAIRTGIQLLLQAKGCSEEDIQQVIIAGAFGSYIDVGSAIAIGMLPSLPLECFRQVGNAAGTGARIALISCSKRVEAQTIARKTSYMELSDNPNFQETFTQALYLG